MEVYKHQKEGPELEGDGPQEGHVQGKNITEELESSGLKGGTEHTPRGCSENERWDKENYANKEKRGNH